MSAFTAFLASIGLAWPAQPAAAAADAPAALVNAPAASQDDPMAVWYRLVEAVRDQSAAQVRIEQHIIWRISPMPGPARESLMAIAPTAPSAPRLVERKMGDCLPMSGIAGG